MANVSRRKASSAGAKNVKQGNVAALKGKKTTLVRTSEPVVMTPKAEVRTPLTYVTFSIEDTLKRAQALANGEKLTPVDQRKALNDVAANCDDKPAKLTKQP